MKLRTQLLLAGAVMLLLPLVAFHTVQQMDAALRDSRAFELGKSTDGIRALLSHSGLLEQLDNGPAISALSNPSSKDLYAEASNSRMVLDGYGDDWQNHRVPARRFTFSDHKSTAVDDGGGLRASVSVRLATADNYLYLLLSVNDQDVDYHKPPLPPVGSEFTVAVEDPLLESIATGDHIVVFMSDSAGELSETVFRAIAPGPLRGRRYGERQPDGSRSVNKILHHSAYWAATNEGYQLEIRLPLPVVNSAFGLAVVDVDSAGAYGSRAGLPNQEAWIGTVNPADTTDIGRLVYASTQLKTLLAEVVPKGSRARLYDIHGRLRADINRLYQRPTNPALLDPAQTHFFNALLFRFFEWVISTGKNDSGAGFPLEHSHQININELNLDDITQTDKSSAGNNDRRHVVKRYINQDRDQVMGSLVHIRSAKSPDSYLLFETNEATANAFTSSAMVRMFSLVTLVGLLVALSLFAYATWLSWRIRRLSGQAHSAVNGEGRVLGYIKGSSAADEIGEMSRSISRLVERTAGYTQYLESLASKLSHELRTPLSVVQTSLENIDSEQFSQSDRQLLTRAQGGASQLGVLIRSMSEAARLEQTVQRSEFIQFDAVAWLQNTRDAYQDVYQQQKFTCNTEQITGTQLFAMPELLQQALDKLIGNAVDFSEEGAEIVILARDIVARDVSVREASGYFDLSVINQGVQLDEARADQLFEPMFSARTTSSSESHLGLGLYIVRLIAEAHGGRVYARNIAQDNSVQMGFTVARLS